MRWYAQESTIFFVLSILRFSLGTESDFHWGYHGNSGPSYWPQHFEGCAGKSQSPIDIKRKDAEYADNLGVLRFIGYGDVRVHKLRNNGHSLQVDVSGNSYIEGGGLPGLYKVSQFHYHWGRTSYRGSEHTLDRTAFPMEMHIVHYKLEYGSIIEALKWPDGLAVLGFMFKVRPFPNIFYEKFLKKLSAVQYSGESTDTSPMPLADILPISWQNLNYFLYNGSLTTPPCTEAAIWTVFTRPIYISEKQLWQFRKLYANEKSSKTYEHLSDNYRPVQPLNDRRVLKNFKIQLL
ncbi:hypothetical protein ACJMK2_011531 [Sinanodonta woodiana]|uniref:Carbonic anhydrase n=1 Tax=Sinanodonta woodiana TaxID=1069815 RepID=A0ABD3V5U3_SINWO